jgi:hypothetical protein
MRNRSPTISPKRIDARFYQQDLVLRESDILRHLFDNIVERCLAEGLVGAEGFAVDASLISADCNKSRSLRSEHWNPEELKDEASRAAREYLATLDDAAFGAASPATPKFISRPTRRRSGRRRGRVTRSSPTPTITSSTPITG